MSSKISFRHPKTLQSKIIQKMLGPKYDSFLNGYRKNRNTTRMDRSEWLAKPLSEKEHAFMHDYLNETETTVSEIGRKHDVKRNKVHVAALRICSRYLFQNKNNIK